MTDPKMQDLVVHNIRDEAEGVISIELRSSDNDVLPEFSAGAHIDLYLSNNQIRSYSLVNEPKARHHYVISVLKEKNSRGGSIYLHEQLKVGDMLRCSLPINTFPLNERAKHSVFVAGGIGITPILCMFRQMRSVGANAELVFCCRSKKQAAFLEELSMHSSNVNYYFDEECGGTPPDLRMFLSKYDVSDDFYCCGPAPMIAAFEMICEEQGFQNYHIERFAAIEGMDTTNSTDFKIKLASTSQVFDIPAGSSVLEVLLDAGVVADCSCREGVCGICETGVLEGIPDHRDSFLSKNERARNNKMMICVSGSKSEVIVLDL